MTYAAYAHYVDAMEADWDFVATTEQGVVRRIGERVPAYWNVGLNLRWILQVPDPTRTSTSLICSTKRSGTPPTSSPTSGVA